METDESLIHKSIRRRRRRRRRIKRRIIPFIFTDKKFIVAVHQLLGNDQLNNQQP
jgi:hypothetical protein